MAGSANVAQAINTAGNAYVSAQATRAQGEYQKRISELNAKTLDAKAEEAIKRGEKDAMTKGQETRRFIGEQKAAMAAGGIDLSSAQATNLLSETETIGAADMANLRSNAWQEAWGFKSEAVSTRGQGEMQNYAAQNTARSTLISGGIDAMSYGLKAGAEYKSKAPKKDKKKEE